jgi:2-succinyl-5-enolpyruvyl-6-hydroxy-3-cyclohexene-1-carboxylate synthase
MMDLRNANTLWASVFVETLFRCGVRQAVVSPGSRSGPLAVALARHEGIEAIPVLDERSAGFFALGLARQHLQPVLLVCTSGTAAANYLPAVIEAKASGVPLVIATADRPPELRGCNAGQAIDQQKIFGAFVNDYLELAVPELDEGRLRYLRQSVAHACARSTNPFPGPVHLNVPLRDPLAPVADPATERFASGFEWNRFFGHLRPVATSEPLTRAPLLTTDLHGLVVVGPAQPRDPRAFASVVGEIARKLGWPVVADALSPIRHFGSLVPGVVTAYDAILRSEDAARRLKPDCVLCLGGWPTSKILRGWLDGAQVPTWLISNRPDNRDALHGSTSQVAISLRTLAASLPDGGVTGGYAGVWRDCEERARRVLDQRLEHAAEFFEPKAAWLLVRHLPAETPVFLASSMPVRDAEYVWPLSEGRIRPYFNRGANGIDGTLSTALGAAHGGPPAVLLTGDLALLHDANGFLIGPKFRGSLTIVLINNQGGGIFNHLPIAQFDPPFEAFFATPQDVDFTALAATHGAAYVRVRDWAHFVEQITVLPETGLRLLEIKTDRRSDAEARKTLFADMAQAAAATG